MMFRKDCTNCERQATVEIDGRPYCSEHAFQKVRAAKGPVPMPKPIK
jgi:hypothetical protein